MPDLLARATQNLSNTLSLAIQLKGTERAFVIYDLEAPLTQLIVQAYRNALPLGEFIEFSSRTAAELLSLFQGLAPGDLVILVQTTNFRLDEFRIRIELFKHGLKTIEHSHLGRMDEDQFPAYIDALAYDPAYYRTLGPALKARLDTAQRVVVECVDTQLVYPSALEPTKLNIGDYAQLKNVGGTFPIGEVFTESRDLRTVNGQARVFAFAGDDHVVRRYEPFLVHVTNGILTAPESPQEFQDILVKIAQDEEVLVRELGFGLNAAMSKERWVNDINAFERQKGIHLSLGAKHGVYPKPGINRKQGRYHVDVFVDVTRILIDEEVVYQGGDFLVT